MCLLVGRRTRACVGGADTTQQSSPTDAAAQPLPRSHQCNFLRISFFFIITQSVCGQTDVERNRGTLGNFSTMDEERGGKATPLPRTASRSCDMTNVSENTSLPVLLLPASVFSRVCRAVSRSRVFISLHVHSFPHPPSNSALIPPTSHHYEHLKCQHFAGNGHIQCT